MRGHRVTRHQHTGSLECARGIYGNGSHRFDAAEALLQEAGQLPRAADSAHAVASAVTTAMAHRRKGRVGIGVRPWQRAAAPQSHVP